MASLLEPEAGMAPCGPSLRAAAGRSVGTAQQLL